MNQSPVRAITDTDDHQLIVEALGSVSRTYRNLIDLYATLGAEPIGMSAALRRALRNNDRMLAVARHPSKGGVS